MTLSLAWLIYGTLDQPTGGYVYDRMIVERLRALNVRIDVISIFEHMPRRVSVTHQHLEASRPDVIVGDALCVSELGPIFEGWANRSLRVLLLHHFRSWEEEIGIPERAALACSERRALEACDQVIATSGTTAQRLHEQYPAKIAHVIIPGADRLAHRTTAVRGPGVRLLGIGSEIPRKRWHLLLDCLERLSAKSVHLRLVGDRSRDRDYSSMLSQQIARSRYLATHVERLGVVDVGALSHELSVADALILPSSLEGYGMVITEALNAGLPVIGANSSAISEVLKSHRDAALCFDNAAQLQSQLAKFVAAPRLRASLRHAAENSKSKLQTWSEAAVRLYNLLLESIADRARSSSASSTSLEPSRTSSAAASASENATLARTSR